MKNKLLLSIVSFIMFFNSVRAEEVYKVVLEFSYPPYVLLDEHGRSTGFDVDILTAIARHQGFSLEFITKNPNSSFEELEAGEYHIAVSGLSHAEVGNNLASNVYAYGYDVIMTKDDGSHFEYLEELKTVKTATQNHTDYADALIEIFGKENENLVLKNTSFLAFKELAQGNVQAIVGSRGVNEYFARQVPNIKFITHPIKDEGYEKYVLNIVVSKQHPELLKKINAGLQQVIDDGSYKELYFKWFNREAEILQ